MADERNSPLKHDESKLAPYKQALYDKAAEERQRCLQWLKKFIIEGQPRPFTKEELRQAAQAELNVSKNSFEFAWVIAIEETGRHDWYKAIRPKKQLKQ